MAVEVLNTTAASKPRSPKSKRVSHSGTNVTRSFKTPGIPAEHWDDFCLQQIFDPNFIENLPVSEQLKYYKKRDLSKSKLYNTARKVWGDRHLGSRWRMLETDGGAVDETKLKNFKERDLNLLRRQKEKEVHFFGGSRDDVTGQQSGSKVVGHTLLWSDDEDFPDIKSSQFYVPRNRRQPLAAIGQRASTNEKRGVVVAAASVRNQSLKRQVDNREKMLEKQKKQEQYSQWVQHRRELRAGLDRMDDLERWLSTKPEISPMEAMVLKRFLEWRYEREEALKPPPPVVRTPSSAATVPPDIDRPLPIMIAVLEAYLQEHKLRLLDYFSMADKTKRWTIGRDQLQAIIAWTKLPVTDAELDDFIQYLDTKGEGFLLYRDIAQTRHRFLVEERKAILAEYGGEISEVLAQQQKVKLQAEKEAERVKKAQEVSSRAKEASFVAYEGDHKLYKVHYGDPRTATEKPDKKPKSKSANSNSKSSGTRQSSSKSQASIILAQRRNENLEGKRKRVASKSSSAPPEGRSGGGGQAKAKDRHPNPNEDDSLNENNDDTVVEVEGAGAAVADSNGGPEKKRGDGRRGKSATVTWSEREWTPVQIERFKELGSRRVVEILNSRSPSVPPSEPDIPDDPNSPFIRTPTPGAESPIPRNPILRSASADTSKTGGRPSSSATTLLLQTPPIDTNECIDFDPEVFFDKAKRLQFYNRRSRERSARPWMGEVEPLMVKCGDGEVDAHMAFCTRWEPLDVHTQRQTFRQFTWEEYEKCVRLCEQKGINLSEKTLKRALLHPADVRITRKHRVRPPDQLWDRQHLPHTMSQLKKFYPQGHPRFQEEEQEAEQLEALAVASVTSALFQYARDAKARREAAEREEDEDGNQSTASSDLDSIEFKLFKPTAKNASNPAYNYPKHKRKKEKETMKLPTGKAEISSKIDNWMSYKDFLEFSRNVCKKHGRYHGFYDPDKQWPGKSYQKRLPEDTRVKASDTMFQEKEKVRPVFKDSTTIHRQLIK